VKILSVEEFYAEFFDEKSGEWNEIPNSIEIVMPISDIIKLVESYRLDYILRKSEIILNE